MLSQELEEYLYMICPSTILAFWHKSVFLLHFLPRLENDPIIPVGRKEHSCRACSGPCDAASICYTPCTLHLTKVMQWLSASVPASTILAVSAGYEAVTAH